VATVRRLRLVRQPTRGLTLSFGLWQQWNSCASSRQSSRNSGRLGRRRPGS